MSSLDGNYGWILKKRKGTSDDPYVYLSHPITVINGLATLKEIPSDMQMLVISDGTKTFFIKKDGLPDANSVVIDYKSVDVHFHTQYNNKQYTVTYYGTGFFHISSESVYAKDSNGSITQTLQDLMDDVNTETEKMNSAANNKINEMDSKINEANSATTNASTQANYAKSQGDYAKAQGDSTKLIWKPYVATEADVETTYTSPAEGWTTQAIDTGVRFRYTNGAWERTEKVTVIQGSNVVKDTVQPTDTAVLWVDLNP